MLHFTSKDYNGGNGFNTKIWGPMVWSFLHMISFNYPVHPTEEDKENYHNYLMSLKNVLCCSACRDNYEKNLRDANYNKSKFKNRESFSLFIYDLHNQVNKMLGKPKYLTYEAIRDRYEIFRAKCVDGVPVIPRKDIERGCTMPINNIKSQCVISIVPFEKNRDTFTIHKHCNPQPKNKK